MISKSISKFIEELASKTEDVYDENSSYGPFYQASLDVATETAEYLLKEFEVTEAALRIAAGYISTTEGWADKHPQEALDWLLEEARKDKEQSDGES